MRDPLGYAVGCATDARNARRVRTPVRTSGSRLSRQRAAATSRASESAPTLDALSRGSTGLVRVLADAIEATLPHRRFRDPDARLFPDPGADALRTAIAKACKAEGIPPFSPHDLRHRRISLLHLRGVPWARIGEFVGQWSLSVTADMYTHVLSDETEVDYAALLRSA